MTTTAYAWAPITKSEVQDDGTLLVSGPAADAGIDRDRQRLDQTWLDAAMPKWMAEGGNVREMHPIGGSTAVGVATGLVRRDDGTHDLTALIVDPTAVKKVQYGVLKGFSVGIREPRLDFGKADAPNGLVVGGDIVEVSLVDRPANPRTRFMVAKVDSAGELATADGAEVEEIDEDEPEGEEQAESLEEDDMADVQAIKADIATLVAAVGEVKTLLAARTTEPAAEVTKADAPATVDNSPTADIVKAAVAEATKPLIDELTLVKADLAKALAMPQAGGPVAMRTASQTQAARETDAAAMRAEAQALLVKADDATHDLTLRQGYRDRARDLLLKAEAAPLR